MLRLAILALSLLGAGAQLAAPVTAVSVPQGSNPSAAAPIFAKSAIPAPAVNPAPAATSATTPETSHTPGPSAPHDSTAPAYLGTAYDYEHNVSAYTESQSESYRDGKHISTRTSFIGADGKPFAERTLDFSRRESDPDYLYKDLRNGYEEGAKTDGADVIVHFRDSKNAVRKEKRIQVPGPCIINGGVGKFVKSRWAEIVAGKKVSFNMVIPARLDYFRFEAYVDTKFVLKPDESKGREYLPVVIEPRNSMLSMLLPVIVMYENPKTQRMVAYQGIVNVADAKGRSMRVRTTYPTQGP